MTLKNEFDAKALKKPESSVVSRIIGQNAGCIQDFLSTKWDVSVTTCKETSAGLQ
jgi:hypothetical protein